MRHNWQTNWRDLAFCAIIGKMMKPTTAEDRQSILEAVDQFSGGASLEEVDHVCRKKFYRRTLQRRLAALVKQGFLVVKGKGRASRYHRSVLIEGASLRDEFSEAKKDSDSDIALCHEGKSVKSLVRQPLHQKKPVGYNREFLYRYQPNKTDYLPQSTRRHLLQIGQSPAGERPAGTYAKQILDRLLIDLSWNSSRLEGNTYSLLETERLLKLGEVAAGRDAVEAQMILNHKAAIELLVDQADEIGFNRYSVLNLHALLSNNLLADPAAGGRLRAIPVKIAGTVYHPLEVPQLIEDCFQRFLDMAALIQDPFEQAFFAMVHLPYLQPFEDVNKRVSRLASNMPFIRGNLCPVSFVDVPERAYVDGILGVYEFNRMELLRDVFVWAYERSSARYAAVRQSLGEPDPFRLRYRQILVETVTSVVRQLMDKKEANTFVRQCAEKDMPPSDQNRFIEVVETELLGLHAGNIARYRVRPSEFEAWQRNWG